MMQPHALVEQEHLLHACKPPHCLLCGVALSVALTAVHAVSCCAVLCCVSQAEDEIASVGPGLSDALAIPTGGAAPSSSESFRRRHRKPQRGPSSTMLAGMEMLASAGVDPSLFSSLLTSKAGASH
jgi:hypothetical protein